MLGFLKSLVFGKNKLRDAYKRGALIVDVRSPQEFDSGRIAEAINIPVDRMPINAKRLVEMDRPIILCCSSGARSGQALRVLKDYGLKEGYNAGNWHRLMRSLGV